MKQKLLLIILIGLLINFKIKAQTVYYPNQASLQYGFFSTAFLDLYYSFFSGVSDINISQRTGPVGVAYQHSLTPRLRLGASFIYEGREVRLIDFTNSVNGTVYTFNPKAFTVAAEFTVMYGINGFARPYGKIAPGVSFRDYNWEAAGTVYQGLDENEKRFSLQFTPIGVEVGNEICGFFELGIGNQGVLAGGVRGRF